MKKLNPVLLDLRGLVINAYHADMSPEYLLGTTKEKINTAEHGFETFLSKFFDPLIETCNSPIHMIAVQDDGNTYRKGLYPAYKQKRGETQTLQDPLEKEQITKCIGFAKAFLVSLGVPIVRLKGQEADDVIAYLAQNLHGHKTIATIDKDLLVLANSKVGVFINGVHKTEYAIAGGEVPAHLVSLYLSLIGDTSDGYIGIKGVGPAAWLNLVSSYGVDGMEQLLDLIENDKRITFKAIAAASNDKVMTKIAENYDEWKLMYALARLRPELCEGAKVALEWYKRAPTWERLDKVLAATGTGDLMSRYDKWVYRTTLVTTDNLTECFKEMEALTEETLAVAWDYETTDTVKNPRFLTAAKGRSFVDVLNSEIAGCSFAMGANMNQVYYFSVAHKDTHNVGKHVVLDVIKHFEGEGIEMVAQNCLPGDTEVLTEEGWVFIDAASETDSIMQWEPSTGALSFVKPLHKTEAFAETLLEWDTHAHKGAYTPAHRMYYRSTSNPTWSVETAERLAAWHGFEVTLPLSGIYQCAVEAQIELTPTETGLMEAMRAEGHFGDRGCHCRFHLSKQRKIHRLEELLEALGISYSKALSKDGAYSIGTASHPITQKIFRLLGKSKVYGQWLLRLPLASKQALLRELSYWGKSTCPHTLEALQILAHTSGWRLKPNTSAHGTIKQSDHCKLGKATCLNWNDKVYCFTVPSGAFMIRRKGVVSITGNCAFEATITKIQLNHDLKYWNDTKCLAHHLDENSPNGLKSLAKSYLNYDQTSYKATLEAAGATDMSEISGEQVLRYGCDDSLVTAHLFQLFTWMTQLEGTYDFIVKYECPSAAELIMPYIHGITLDPVEMAKQTAADKLTVEEKMVLMRALLAEHCTSPNVDAVEVLFDDQKDYVTYKTKQKFLDNPIVGQGEISAAIKKAHADYRLNLKENSRYIEPYEYRAPVEWLPTPSKMTKLATILGYPEITKVTKKFLCDYISNVRETDGPGPLIDLLGPAIEGFSKRAGVGYDAYKLWAEEVFLAAATPVMQGTEMNLGSPHQMLYLMYLMLELPVRIRTKVQKDSLRHNGGLLGSPAGNKAAIDFALANDCDGDNAWKAILLNAMSEYSKASTRLGIYWGPYPLWMGEDFVIHPNFSNPGTVTRRPSGSSPNLLQVSKGAVRNCFIPRSSDNVIVSVDFASQELRVMAAVTMDANFLSAYMGADGDKDLHAMTACGVVASVLRMYPDVDPASIKMDGGKVDYAWFKEHQDDDTPVGYMLRKVRGISKTVNFGAGYGAVGATVSQQAMIPLEIADLAVEGMMASYPGINIWKKKIYAFAKERGYVATTYGSRRHCGNALSSGNRTEVGRWERQLSNFLIQGQCADLLKIVLANAHTSGLFKNHRAMLLAPVYDEILSEVPKDAVHGYLHDLADLMEINMPGIVVPMVADCSIGDCWGNQVELGNRPTLEKVNEALLKIKNKAKSEILDDENDAINSFRNDVDADAEEPSGP